MVLTIGLGLAWLILTGKPKPSIQPQEDPLRPVVSVIVTELKSAVLAVHTQGAIEPRRRISVVAQVGGKVAAVSDNFVEGAFFEPGAVLLEIESDDYEFAIARARSQVAAADQRVAEERGRNRQAKREWRQLGSPEANALFLREPQLKAAESRAARGASRPGCRRARPEKNPNYRTRFPDASRRLMLISVNM